FDRRAVTAMLAADENKQITNVKVGSVSKVDESTDSIGVSVSWGESVRSLTYKVRKDPARTHDLFYPSWRVQVPFTTIPITTPSPGASRSTGSTPRAVLPAKSKLSRASTKLRWRLPISTTRIPRPWTASTPPPQSLSLQPSALWRPKKPPPTSMTHSPTTAMQ